MNDKWIEALKERTRSHGVWEGYLGSLSTTGSTPFSVHLAVLLEPYLKFILEGTKTVESRFSKNRIAPYGVVESGDVVLLKRSGAKSVSGLCIVRRVWFYQLDNENLQVIKNDFSAGLRADGSAFWEQRQSARFATLMRISEVYRLPPIEIQKRDRRGWVVLRRRQQHYMATEEARWRRPSSSVDG